MINGDGADPTCFPGPIRPGHDFVPLAREGTTHLLGQAPLNAQFVRLVGVRFERARIAVCGEARCFSGCLRQHAKHCHVQEDLQHRLTLHIATWGAKWHIGLAVLEDHRRARSETWALARCHGTGMPLDSPGLRTASRDYQACPRYHGSLRTAITGCCGKDVTLLVNDTQIGCIEQVSHGWFRHRGQATPGSSGPVAAPGHASWRYAWLGFVELNQLPALSSIFLGQ